MGADDRTPGVSGTARGVDRSPRTLTRRDLNRALRDEAELLAAFG